MVRIFPEKSAPVAPPAPTTPPAVAGGSDNGKPKVDLSIPVYRVENERPPLPRERRPLSSFAIAMLILSVLLVLGGGAIYNYMQKTSDHVAGLETGAPKASKPAAQAKPATAEVASPAPESQPVIATRDSAMSVLPQAPDALSEEAKLEAELTLRQMAEEDFRRQLQQINGSQKQQAASTPETAPSAIDEAGEAAATSDTTERASVPPAGDPVPAAADTTDLQAPDTAAPEDTVPASTTPDP